MTVRFSKGLCEISGRISHVVVLVDVAPNDDAQTPVGNPSDQFNAPTPCTMKRNLALDVFAATFAVAFVDACATDVAAVPDPSGINAAWADLFAVIARAHRPSIVTRSQPVQRLNCWPAAGFAFRKRTAP